MLRKIKRLWYYRELIQNLVMREIKQRYKQSILGYAWVILNPLAQMLVLSFVFSIVMRVSSWDIPYPIFLYVGLLPWNLFANSVMFATDSLVSNASLIKKVYFPREIFPLVCILSKTVDFILAAVVLVLFMIFYKIPVNINLLWVFPIFAIQLIFTLGLSFFTSALNLFYRDIQYLMNLVLLLWFYLTPVIYPVEMVPDKYRFIFQLNPMSVLINAYRQVILGGSLPKLSSLVIAVGVSLIFFVLGYRVFKKLEGLFADIV